MRRPLVLRVECTLAVRTRLLEGNRVGEAVGWGKSSELRRRRPPVPFFPGLSDFEKLIQQYVDRPFVSSCVCKVQITSGLLF